MDRFKLLLLGVFSLFAGHVVGQLTGIPEIINFTKEDFGGGLQTWEINQLTNGYIIAANNDGLLVFDGVEWKCYKQPNATILRSIAVHEDTVFCGGQNELGYFEFQTGKPVYHSLLENQALKEINLEEVWDLVYHDSRLLVRTSNWFFTLEPNGDIVSSEKRLGRLTLGPNETPILFSDSSLLLVDEARAISFGRIDSEAIDLIHTESGDTLLVTLDAGLIRINSVLNPIYHAISEILMEYGVNSVHRMDDGFIFCTIRGGLLSTDLDLQLKQIITVADGLQRNDIYGAFLDNSGDLWLGTSNGIDLLKTSAPFSFIHPDGYLKGGGYDFATYQNVQYYGTNNGLYALTDPARNAFTPIAGTTGQVWGLDTADNLLWISHHEGLFTWDGTQLQKILKGGCWKICSIPNDPNRLLVGGYEGLSIIEKDSSGNWTGIVRLTGISESSRIIVHEKDDYWWISHPYYGAWRFRLPVNGNRLQDVTFYGKENGFPSDLMIYVESIGGEIVFTSEEGLYTYNRSKDLIEPLPMTGDRLAPDTHFLRVFEGSDENMWFVTDKEVGLFDVQESALAKDINVVLIPGLKNRLVNGFEKMRFDGKGSAVIGTDDGFARINLDEIDRFLTRDPGIRIREITLLENDTNLFSPFSPLPKEPLGLPERITALRIKYAPASYEETSKFHFETKMEGFEQEWVNDDGSMFRDYTNLASGDYVFVARILSSDGIELSRVSLPISVAKPWYRKPFAIVLWVAVLLLISLIFYRWNALNTEKEKQAIVEQKERELEQQKKESVQVIDKLRSERLESEIVHKNKELASATMHLVQKGKILQGVRDSLKQISLEEKEKANKEIRRIIKMINNDIKLDNTWDQFERHFDQVHVNFTERLRQKHPTLTPNDQKLCAYLRMNLSTKEIATIMNISIRGVEIARYRLRKKLGIAKEVNLTEYVLDV